MLVAVVTSAEPKELFVDMEILCAAFRKRGIDSRIVIWDDPEIEWSAYNVTLINSTWDYTEKLNAFISWCDHVSKASRLINSFETVKANCNKRYLQDLQVAGILVPITSIYERGTAFIFNKLLHKGPVVVKPLIGAGGTFTFRFDNIHQAIESSEVSALHAKADIIIQDFVPEILTHGEYGAVIINGRLSHCVLKNPSDNEFRVQPEYGGAVSLAEAPPYTEDLCMEVFKVLGHEPTYARVDFIATPEPLIMEVEMIEPDLHLGLYPIGADKLVSAIMD